MSRLTLRRKQLFARIALASWLVTVIALTLAPNPGRGQRINLHPSLDLTHDLRNTVLNVLANLLLFMPFGALASAANIGVKTWWRVLLAAAVVGSGLEAAQWFMEVGRATDINDVIANALGSMVGFTAATLLVVGSRKHRPVPVDESRTVGVTGR